MNKKSIMIIGAGFNQINLIKSAKEAGYTAVVIDPNNEAPGAAYADVFYDLNGDDFDGHCTVIEKHKIGGIVSSQMDKPLQFMAKLAARYGFNFVSEKSALWARNKYEMKKRFLQHGVPCARGGIIKNGESGLEEKIQLLSFPLIMKPLDAYSSRGVVTVSDTEDIKRNIASTHEFSSNGSVLIEEYISGRMISVEGFIYRGNIQIIQYTERYKFTPKPFRVELGHIQPALLSEEETYEVNETLCEGLRALELDNCGYHAELKINNDGAFIIEIGARLGGDFNASHLVPLSTGINIEKIAAQIAMGDEPVLPERKPQFAMIKWLELEENRKIEKLPDLAQMVAKTNEIVEMKLFLKESCIVPRVTDSSKRAGYIILKGDSRYDVIKKSSNIEKLIKEYIKYYPSKIENTSDSG